VTAIEGDVSKSSATGGSKPPELAAQLEEELIVHGLCGGDLRVYSQSYAAFKQWAMNSMDIVRTELLSLCFPIFVHWLVHSS